MTRRAQATNMALRLAVDEMDLPLRGGFGATHWEFLQAYGDPETPGLETPEQMADNWLAYREGVIRRSLRATAHRLLNGAAR